MGAGMERSLLDHFPEKIESKSKERQGIFEAEIIIDHWATEELQILFEETEPVVALS